MLWVSVFCVSVAGSLLPGFATELYVLGIATLIDPVAFAPVILIGAAGQVAGKLLVFGIARAGGYAAGAAGLELNAARAAVARAGRAAPALVFFSALASVPPWYLTTIACGVVGSPIVPFAAAGFAGRVLRAGAVVCFARLVLEVAR
jgi:membrane protein YqaA with SNARE-associated domain